LKVNIIGKSKTWIDAPFDDTESWGITQLLLQRPCDLVIDMNVYEDGRWGEDERQEAAFVRNFCRINNIPLVDLKTYPLAEVMERFDTDYFSSTVDYAIALALYRGYTDINLYGATMADTSDYYKIKCGADFWCGYAKGMGVKITVHGETSIMKTTDGLVYGYDIPQKENGSEHR
jgi:hypothetical protein